MMPQPSRPCGAVSPWRRLNLRHNPFGEPPPEEAASLIVLPTAEAWAAELLSPRRVLQFLGEGGRGKTARLRFLGARFPGAPYVYLAADQPLPRLPAIQPRPGGGPALLLDETQRLPRWRRRRLFRRVARSGAALVLASHENLTAELERVDLEVHTVVVAGLDVEALVAIVDRRLQWAQVGLGPLPPWCRFSRQAAHRLLERFGDDLRALLDHLYEDYQSRLYSRGKNQEASPWPSAH